MIATITLNALVDKAYKIAGKVQAGTVTRVIECKNTAGGKGLNVARVVQFCGESVMAGGMIGGFNGEYVKHLLEQDGIKSQFTKIKNETR